AQDLEDGDDPISFPPGMSTTESATLTISRRQRVCAVPVADFVDPSCTQWAEVSQQTYKVWLKPRGSYATATYDQSFFDFEDSPLETGYRKVKVTSAVTTAVEADRNGFPAFKAEGYTPVLVNNVEKSSYPKANPVGVNVTFALHGRDLDFYKAP